MGGDMVSKATIRKTVLAFYRTIKPDCDEGTSFKKDMGLLDAQIEQYNTSLAKDLWCNPKRSDLVSRKTIGDLIELLNNTRISTRGVLYATFHS